ncbi:ferredoxin [Cognatiyoonia sp. IB215182]|uniref:ferredoxin n=1 Tax=Cognatiyoonia sp. IB215182 TaxID=3097353 RepID=UPI002A15DC89|nr:ferredoxin [Cognatiyoonia sp. IB215182]MDX8354198.1 ferredoxin [Cognatiyoonia sp. IB215182]
MSLNDALRPHGLRSLGDCPDGLDTITLIGPDEPRLWAIFTESAEYQDGAANPLDRWSQRVITAIADDLGAEPLFPFGGPPYAPFFTWAVQSGRFWASPIGFLVHDEVGLFVSFRGALRQKGVLTPPSTEKPCTTCPQPCATACPVGAFDDGYDVAACKAHAISAADVDCRTGGCLARRACPVGQGLRLPAQAAFHMEAFL